MNLNKVLLFLLMGCQITFSQKLTLSDLETICNKSDWENVNQFLMNKNWEYYESKKGDTEKYSTITWSYEKSYDDKAVAWFYLYTYEGYPNKISYSVFNKPSYSLIQNSLKNKGYRLENSEIEDNELISTYTNSHFILKITTEKREQDKYSAFDKSITAYRFMVIKKSSIYDPDNGKKTDYYYGNTKQAEYTLKDGKMDGLLKVYYENGQLKKTGTYSNGLAKGKFIEYDENGEKSFEYIMSNGNKNGKFTVYENNKVSYTSIYKNDILNGEYIAFYYNKETGELDLKLIGSYLDGEKEGVWRLVYIDKEGERILTRTNYSNGLRNGFVQEINGDSLVVANYRNDKLYGDYKIYIDVRRALFGGVIRTDTTELALITTGNYNDDFKVGNWKYYDITNTLRLEGGYVNNEKNDEWKSYYAKYKDGNGNYEPYSQELFLIENYKYGKLNGISKRLSYLNEETYKCSELDKNNQPIDSCTRLVYKKVLQTSNYKSDKLEGLFELRDSLNEIIAKGNYANDLRSGKWFHRFSDKDVDGKDYNYFMEGSYKNGEKEGEWVLYYEKGKVVKTINYAYGKLHGKYTEWGENNKVKEIKNFRHGKLNELVVYDSLGIKPIRKFEIFDEYSNRYKCKYTQFHTDGKTSQVYWVKKEGEIDHNWFELLFLLKLKTNDENVIYREGEYLVYDEMNKPIVKGKYFTKNKIGEWTYFFYPQQVKIEIEYDDNSNLEEKYLDLNNTLFSGDFIYIDEDNNIKEVRKIKRGLRNGNTEFIDINTGKRIKKIKYKDGKIK